MQKKKNKKADIGRNSAHYFALALAFILFIAYGTINYKTFDKSLFDSDKLLIDELDDEEVPITEQIKPPPPPPPPPPAPEVIEIVEDEEEIEETVIESTETDQEEEIEIEEIEIEEVEEDVEVPFAVIENVPVFPGCKGSNSKKKKCMSEKIAKFVQRRFNTDLAGDLGLSGRQRINVIFKIDKRGNVTSVRARAPHPRLEKEAVRVIKLLPKFEPGKQRGKAVIVPYSLPIIFQVQD